MRWIRNPTCNTAAPLPAALEMPIHLSPADTYENVDLNRGSYNDTNDRTLVEVGQALQGRSAVILVFGQSNGANSGDTPYTPTRAVFNFNLFDGMCYVAKDPLLGATEARGNFASRLADMLIEQNIFDTVILAPISVGGSRIEEWTTGGTRHRRLQVAIARAHILGLRFTHALWHQGESNAGQDADQTSYMRCFMDIHSALRRYGVGCPIYVAQATACNSPPNPIIRSAQRGLVNPMSGILAGPDTDAIGIEDRFDNCHMKESGLVKHARMWAEVLTTSGQAQKY